MREFYEDLWEHLPAELAPPELERRRAFLATLPEGLTLDLGCGDGSLTPEGAVGADIADAALHRARGRRPDGHWVRGPEYGPLPFADGTFAVIWCSEVLEHVADTARFLAEARRVLAPGGTLALTVPRLRAHHALRPAKHLHPLGDHLRFYVAGTLTDVLDDAGLAEIAVRRGGPLLLATARRPA